MLDPHAVHVMGSTRGLPPEETTAVVRWAVEAPCDAAASDPQALDRAIVG